jgi:succinate-acetate transporter protein
LIPGGFEIEEAYGGATFDFYAAFGFYVSSQPSKPTLSPNKADHHENQIFAWFIFTFLLWLCTLKSTLAFSSLFCMVWIAFICLGAAYLDAPNTADGHPHVGLTRAGGVFGMIAAFIAWYNMLAGIMEPSNSFFAVPVVHFPWSEKGRANRRKSVSEESMV